MIVLMALLVQTVVMVTTHVQTVKLIWMLMQLFVMLASLFYQKFVSVATNAYQTQNSAQIVVKA